MKTLLELGDKECRYPVTEDAPHRFCGAQKAVGSSYCSHHHDVCSIPGSALPALRNQAHVPVKQPQCEVVPLDVLIRQLFHNEEPSKNS